MLSAGRPRRSPAQVTLGWAFTDATAFDIFVKEVAAAPEGLRPALGVLCTLWGLTRVEQGLACHLAMGEPGLGRVG